MDERTETACAELGQLSDERSQEEFLRRAPDLLDLQVVRDLAEAVRKAVRVDVRKALVLAEAALAIARHLNVNEALGFALRAKANALWFKGDCKSAVVLFDGAAASFEHAGEMNEVGRTLSSSIQSLALIGEYDRAFAAAERAKEIFSALGESWRIARVDINVANIYHRQNLYAEALSAYERAYRELLPHRDMEGIGVALHNIAVCLVAMDDFEGALATYARVRSLCEQHDMPLLVAQADYNVAYLHYLRGDYTRALELLRSTREICRNNGDAYHLGLCDLDESEILLELNLTDEAGEIAQNSVEHFQRLGMGFELARSLTNLAIAVNAQGDSQRALELLAQAKETAVRESSRVWPYLIDLYRAIILLSEGEIAGARDLASRGADFFRSAHLPSKHVFSLLLLARAALEAGDREQSADHCDEALRIVETLDSPLLVYQARFLHGQIYEARGQFDKAYSSYQQSRVALETLRSSIQREELRMGLMQNRLEVYTRLVQLCLAQEDSEQSTEEALSYVEAAKSRTLRDLILGEAQPRFAMEQDQLDNRVRELRNNLNWFYHRIEREQLGEREISHEKLSTLTAQAHRYEHELLRLLRDAPVSARVPSALQASSVATITQIRSALGSNAALLEYFALGDQIYAGIIAAGTLKMIPLAPMARIAHNLRMLQFQLSKFRLNREYVSRFQPSLLKATQTHLNALYTALIAPAQAFLTVKNLIVVPFGMLHSLPFHALFDGHRYLVDMFTVSYAPSASVFVHSHAQMEARSGRSLILGLDHPAMPFIQEEVESVASAVPNPVLLWGPDATAEALKEYGRDSALIHIASHGSFREDNPMFSSVKLADSYVTLYDLYHLRLPVDLLTLSGCLTGLNVVAEGDELLGLTRGLLYAGARSLLLSLWDVDDRSTSEFMKGFYCQLQRARTKADALQTAMIALREQYPHPFYWAPFKLIGRALV